MADPIRFVKELGLWAFSRGCRTCRWQTEWCARYCYNKKFYRVNPKLSAVDRADELYWQKTSDFEFARIVRELNVKRFRFSIRGEIWADVVDVQKVASILYHAPDTLFWIPTRAWRVVDMQHSIEEQVLRLPNARVMASMDPSVSEYTEKALKRLGWSTVFAGDNSDPRQLLLHPDVTGRLTAKRTFNRHRCTKTWDEDHAACATCKDGCFRKERVDVHLRQHR